MGKFRPIAMRCTQEQFYAIVSKLKGFDIHNIVDFVDFVDFNVCNYLVNNLNGNNNMISNIPERCKKDHNREVYEEWNEEIFLKACGIEVETLQDRLANLEKEIKEVKALIEEENKPKIGDICKFWDDDKSIFIVSKLERFIDIEDYSFCVDGIGFKNCEKITDENFLKAFNNL